MLNAFRPHTGGHLFAFYLLPIGFQCVASVRNSKSKIENPESCVGPSAILTGSRTRPSDWGPNARFGPVEDRRNNRRLATFTQIWWPSPFTSRHLSPPESPGWRLQGLTREWIIDWRSAFFGGKTTLVKTLAWIPMQKKKPNNSPDFLPYFG